MLLESAFVQAWQDRCELGLEGLDELRLLEALTRTVPEHLLEVPLAEYRVCNIRFNPPQKLVVGLTAPGSLRTLGMRFVPRSVYAQKLCDAQHVYPANVFGLEAYSALVWVFPAERKLDLRALQSLERVDAELQMRRGYAPAEHELVHYMPEHAFTWRTWMDAGGERRTGDYLKRFYNDAGQQVLQQMQCLAGLLACHPLLTTPSDAFLLDDNQTLVQNALPVTSGQLEPMQHANALAALHSLPLPDHSTGTGGSYISGSSASGLPVALHRLLCDESGLLRELETLHAALDDCARSHSRHGRLELRPVITHGDAHPGNFLPLQDGRIGMIDLDSVRIGDPADDLVFYLASTLMPNLHELPVPTDPGPFLEQYRRSAAVAVSRSICPSEVLRRVASSLIGDRLLRALIRGKIRTHEEVRRVIDLASQLHDGLTRGVYAE